MASFPNAVAFDDDTDEVNFVCDATDVHDDFYVNDNDEKNTFGKDFLYTEIFVNDIFFLFANCFHSR